MREVGGGKAERYVPKHLSPEALAAWDEGDTGAIEPLDSIAPEDDATETEEVPVASDVSDEGEERAVSVGRSAALMSALVIVSRITGFFRTWGQAMALGVTVTSSCYTVANNLPNQLYELVMGGMLATAFLPVYLSVKERLGREGSNKYASNLLSLVTILMGALALLGIVFAGQAIWTQSFGATSEFDFDLATYFFRFFAIEVVLYALSSIISGVLNAERDYLWSNAAPIFNNVVCTASFFIYAALVDSQPALAIFVLAIGNPLGVAIQVVMQLPSLRKHGIRLRPYVNLRDPALRETLSIGIPSLVVTISSFATVSVQTSSALSVTPAGSSIAYYTRLWYTLPYAILAIPITTAMFTELSDLVSKDDMGGFVRGVASGTSQVLFFLSPFMLYLVVFSVPLITLMAAGRFTPDEIALTASYLRVLALSLPLYGICTYLQKACSALRCMHLYAIANIVGGAVQIWLCLAFTQSFGLNMVPLSSLAIFAIVDFITLAQLRRKLGRIGVGSMLVAALRSLALGAAGAAVGFGVYTALTHVVAPLGSSALQAVLYLAAAGIPAVAVTFGLAIALKLPESSTIRSLVARVLHRG
ncbi:MAG: murein biosynthesis integral membrane protein MurJ [Atopobiaceae bacterium]|nr:murein biosynthesis integral membrane protein MurJ [Atopobiaceae bacterium]